MSKIKLSMVIPTYTLGADMEEMALFCAESYMDQVDELIIIEDSGIESEALKKLADIYIVNDDNLGFTKNVNKGWAMAKGDFVAIASSDTYLISGKLDDLCVPGKVTSPLIVNQGIPRLAGPFWVTPKEVCEERGMLMEEMHTYCSDSEYDHRTKDIFQKVPSVRIHHRMAQTVRPAGIEGGSQQANDRQIYQQLIKEGKAAC